MMKFDYGFLSNFASKTYKHLPLHLDNVCTLPCKTYFGFFFSGHTVVHKTPPRLILLHENGSVISILHSLIDDHSF